MGFLDSLGGGGLGLVGGAIGAIGGLLGGSKTKDFGSSGDLSAGRSQLGGLGAIGGQYGNLSGQDLSQYQGDNSQYRDAAANEANYLRQDPYTDQYSTAQLARATSGTAAAYQRAQANLSASNAGAGFGGGSGSALSGGEAGIEAGAAGSMAQAQNSLALNRIQQHGQNLQALSSLYGGMAGQDYGRGVSALGAQQGVDQSLAGQYLGLGQGELGMEQNYQAQQRQALDSGLGGFGSALGQYAYYNQKPGGGLGSLGGGTPGMDDALGLGF